MTSLCLTGKFLKQSSFVSKCQLPELKALCKKHQFNYTSCISSIQLWHMQLQSIGNCCYPLSNHLAETSESLSASQPRSRTAPPKLTFPKVSQLKGILATFPHPQVRCSLLHFYPYRLKWTLFLGILTASSWRGREQVWRTLQNSQDLANCHTSFHIGEYSIQNQIKRSAMFATSLFPSFQHIREICFHAKKQCFRFPFLFS